MPVVWPPHGVFPAHAGMFPGPSLAAPRHAGFPRARGDVPGIESFYGCEPGFSPRTRGCSQGTADLNAATKVFPAHAGMFPTGRGRAGRRDRFPRARGDVPAGAEVAAAPDPFSPRTRGCSPNQAPPLADHQVFPAHAGMFPHPTQPMSTQTRFPRARGDVPPLNIADNTRTVFSPRTRGCSDQPEGLVPGMAVFPAHAGMFLMGVRLRDEDQRFPRARGDVPSIYTPLKPLIWFSPRTRGCSSSTVNLPVR